MRIEYHRTLIEDRVRNVALHEALRRLIVPGETVVADIGAGTGLLGLLAAKLGAKRVYLIEAAAVADVARRVAKANRIERCTVVPVHSTALSDPPRVDVVVSETLGNYPFEENIIQTLADARRRFLKPGGTIVPASLEQFVAPVIASRCYDELSVWDHVGFDLDFAPAKAMSLNNIYVRTFGLRELLEEGRSARRWDAIEFAKDASPRRKGGAQWRIDAPLRVWGFALWWRAELVPGVSLATGPDAPRTHWEQLYLPVLRPLSLGAGETLGIEIRSTSDYERGTDVAWTVTRRDAAGGERERQKLDLARGFLP